jgi:hypothetical protein
VVQSVTFFGFILVPYLRVPAAGSGAQPRAENPIRKWLILPTDYGFLIWTFVLTPWPAVFFPVYTLMFLAAAGMLGLALRKWWRDLSPSGGQS